MIRVGYGAILIGVFLFSSCQKQPEQKEWKRGERLQLCIKTALTDKEASRFVSVIAKKRRLGPQKAREAVCDVIAKSWGAQALIEQVNVRKMAKAMSEVPPPKPITNDDLADQYTDLFSDVATSLHRGQNIGKLRAKYHAGDRDAGRQCNKWMMSWRKQSDITVKRAKVLSQRALNRESGAALGNARAATGQLVTAATGARMCNYCVEKMADDACEWGRKALEASYRDWMVWVKKAKPKAVTKKILDHYQFSLRNARMDKSLWKEN